MKFARSDEDAEEAGCIEVRPWGVINLMLNRRGHFPASRFPFSAAILELAGVRRPRFQWMDADRNCNLVLE